MPDNKAVATYHNGKYYLACKMKFPDEEKIGCESVDYTNNAILEIDLDNGSFSITRGIDVVYLYGSKDYKFSELFCCYRSGDRVTMGFINQSGSVNGVPTKKSWKSPATDFGYPYKDKILKEIYFNANQPTDIIIDTEKTTKKYKAYPVNGLVHLNINLVGKEFAIHFEIDTDTVYVSNPKVILGVIS